MKFKIIISRWANFYFFVQNLSEWHFSNRKKYNILWRKELGVFSVEEEDILKQFREIRLKYPQSRSCFESAFFLSEDPFSKLSDILPTTQYQITKNTFLLLENKFNSLYAKDLPLLHSWQKALAEIANDEQFINTALTSLNSLFKTSIREKDIDIYLLFSTTEHTGGGANINNYSISVESSRYPLEKLNHVIGIIWHETIHLVFQNQYFYPLLMEYFSEDRQSADFINEVTIGALFPKGMMGIRLLKNKPTARLSPEFNIEQTTQTLNLIKEYLDQNKRLDEDYLKRLELIIKKA